MNGEYWLEKSHSCSCAKKYGSSTLLLRGNAVFSRLNQRLKRFRNLLRVIGVAGYSTTLRSFGVQLSDVTGAVVFVGWPVVHEELRVTGSGVKHNRKLKVQLRSEPKIVQNNISSFLRHSVVFCWRRAERKWRLFLRLQSRETLPSAPRTGCNIRNKETHCPHLERQKT